MSQQSDIEWTDATWNPVRGCTKVSPGCANCYAETFAERWRGVPGHPYEQGFDLRLVPEKLAEPLRWRAGVKEDCQSCMGSGSKNDAISCGTCAGTGYTVRPKRIFTNSMSDLFQDGVPDAFIDQAFAVMALAPQHTFQVLTKRADRMRAYLAAEHRHAAIVAGMDMPSWLPSGRRFLRVPENWPMPNVWLGVSVENQRFADERIPLLCDTPAAVRFISAEPLLESIDVRRYLAGNDAVREHGSQGSVVIRHRAGIDWLIVGAESGPGARGFDVQWVRDLKEQVDCSMGATRLFVKQLGAKPIIGPGLATLRLKKKGGDIAEFPPDLRVREFPDVRA